MKGDRMKSAMFELYKALKQIVAPSGDFEHTNGITYDWLIKGEDINRALDVLKKYKKQFDEENRTIEFERIDITQDGVCGYDEHMYLLEGESQGMMKYKNTIYFWAGGCPGCLIEKIKEIKSK